MRVALIGYMGSGKSYWAEKLAVATGLHYLDLDVELERRDLNQSISSFISTKGELAFRKLERARLQELAATNGELILATGGGTPCYYDNMDVLNDAFTTVYIDCSVILLAERLENEKEQRPLINHLSAIELKEFVAKHLFERRLFYSRADITLKGEGLTLTELLTAIKKD